MRMITARVGYCAMIEHRLCNPKHHLKIIYLLCIDGAPTRAMTTCGNKLPLNYMNIMKWG